jgi:hypothetical protein
MKLFNNYKFWLFSALLFLLQAKQKRHPEFQSSSVTLASSPSHFHRRQYLQPPQDILVGLLKILVKKILFPQLLAAFMD